MNLQIKQSQNYSRIILLLVGALLFPSSMYAFQSSNILKLDIANGINDTTTIKTGNIQYQSLMLVNRSPNKIYQVQIESRIVPYPPLDLSFIEITSEESFDDHACPLITARIDSLKQTFDKSAEKDEHIESDVARHVNYLKNKLRTIECNSVSVKNMARFYIKLTERDYELAVRVRSNETVTITVTRNDGVTWTWKLEGDQSGRWLVNYGFGFTSVRLERATFKTEENSDGDGFNIVKRRNPEKLDLNYTPAVFFNFFPFSKADAKWIPSLTGGLGFDLSAPVIFIAPNLMYRHNIGLSFGVAFQQQDRLKRRYSESDNIESSLDFDQLHDQVYHPNLFLSLNFRFGSNPFKNDD